MQLAVDVALATDQPLAGLLQLPAEVVLYLRDEVVRRDKEAERERLREELRAKLKGA